MGVLIKEREKQCTGASECISRPMTEAEMLKYGCVKPTKEKPVFHIPVTKSKGEVEKMSAKITPPEKEKLIEVLAEAQGKTKALYHAVKVFGVSAPVISRWIKEYDIEFDADGKVIIEHKTPDPEELKELDKQMEEVAKIVGDGVTDRNVITKQGEKLIQEATEQISERKEDGLAHAEVKYELKYKPIDIFPKPLEEGESTGTITITGQETREIPHKLGYAEYDIKDALVQIDFRQELVSISEGKEMTFEEAIAAAELILDILGHE